MDNDRSDVQSVRSTATGRGRKGERFKPGLLHAEVTAPVKSVGFFDQHVLFKARPEGAVH